MITISYIIFICYFILLSLNTVLYSINTGKGFPKWIKIISVYLWSMLIIQVVSDVMAYITSDNLYFSHIYFYSQFIWIGILYYKIFDRPDQRKFIRLYIIFTSVLLLMQYLIVPGLWFRFNLVEVFVTNYLLVLCSLMYNYSTLSKNKSKSFSIFNLGVLTYSILSLSFFLFGNIMSTIEINISIYIWVIHNIILIFLHLTILLQWIKLVLLKKKTYVRSN